jgi:hypothetical protein
MRGLGEFWSDDPDPWNKLLIVYALDPGHGYYVHANFIIECIDNYESRRRHWGHMLRVLESNAKNFTDANYIAEYSAWLVDLYVASDAALSDATSIPVDPAGACHATPTDK